MVIGSKKYFKKAARSVNANVKILLYAKSAGRCEMCNKLIIKDKMTRKDINLAEKAHIYAFSKGGSRFKKNLFDKNNIDNLMLICSSCHTKIDKKEQLKYYTAEYLIDLKKQHEKRIELVTSFRNNRRTMVLKMVANINGEIIKLSDLDIRDAIFSKKMFFEENPYEIDFTNTSGIYNKIYWDSKKQDINEMLINFYGDLNRNKVEHISVFAIGPIPLLMYLGSKLENKIKTKIFQRHRDGESWIWKKGSPKAKYRFRTIRKGKNKSKVALLISLSGSIKRSLLPDNVIKNYFIYELRLGQNPNYNFLRTEKDLYNFEKKFTTIISKIKNDHEKLKSIDIFPAIPAPVAVVCGKSLNKNSDPKLRLFNTSNNKKFKYTLTIN